MDIAVTVPKTFANNGKKGLAAWIDEGDLPGEEWSGEESRFYLGGRVPKCLPGDRVYVFCEGKLRGFAPLVRIEMNPYSSTRWALVRRDGAIAVTVPMSHFNNLKIGFRGWRYRWWDREIEIPFPDWMTP